MRIVKLKKNNQAKVIQLVREVLTQDGLVVIPSDTVYGLAAKASSDIAVGKILDFKGRQSDKGIAIFLTKLSQIKNYTWYHGSQLEIIKSLLPGQFTVVLNSKHQLSALLEPRDGTLGIRIVEDVFINQLLEATKFPLTATSANISGKGPHYSIASLLKTLSGRRKALLDLVVDAGRLPKVPPSTVVRLIKENLEILRDGLLNPKLLIRYESRSEKKTKILAQRIFQHFWQEKLKNQAVVVLLRGDLGSGKTVFSKGIGDLFNQDLVSPTFVLLDEYLINQETVKTIYHLDLYRIEEEAEIVDLKLENFLQAGNLMLIEWGEKLSILNNLRKRGAVFYWLQIESKSKNKRQLKLFQL